MLLEFTVLIRKHLGSGSIVIVILRMLVYAIARPTVPTGKRYRDCSQLRVRQNCRASKVIDHTLKCTYWGEYWEYPCVFGFWRFETFWESPFRYCLQYSIFSILYLHGSGAICSSEPDPQWPRWMVRCLLTRPTLHCNKYELNCKYFGQSKTPRQQL